MFKRFTSQARDVVVRAKHEADRAHKTSIGSEYLLLALLADEAGVAARVLRDAGVDQERVRAEITRRSENPPSPLGEDAAAALRTVGIDLDVVLARIEESFGPNALRPPEKPSKRESLWGGRRRASRFTPRAKKILELSLRESIRLGHNYLGVEHLLLALLRDGRGEGAKLLTDAGLRLDEVYSATLGALRQAA